MFVSTAYAMAPPPGAETTPIDSIMSFAPLVVLMVIFYFFIIRPQQKKQQETKELIDNLKEGDRVLTQGGIIGTVTRVKEKELTIEIAQDVRIKINRSYVTSLASKD